MIVDPAIHVLGWSRRRAIDYMVRELYTDTTFAEMYADRMSVWPAQAVTYGTGNLFIRQLRRDAAATQGPAFDIRAFHDAVLRNGAVPLSALEAEVRRWERSVSARPVLAPARP